MQIKALLVDVDGTLLDFEKGAHESMLAAAEELSVALPSDIYPTFKRINNGLWHRVEDGSLTRDELYRIRWNTIFGEAGVDFDGVVFEKAFYANIYTSAVPVEGALEALEYLHGKYPVYVATNALYEQQAARLKKAGMQRFIKEIFASERIGAAKPSKAFFEACIKQLSPIAADEVMMIGDSLSADIEGAKDFGLRTCWYSPEGEKSRYADFTVTKMADIKNIL